MKHSLFLLLIGPGILISANVTKYVESGKMANGQQTYVGAVACPRSIKLGVKVLIDGKTYTCTDRYAQWVHTRQGNTFDIFTEESRGEALQFGRKTSQVLILN